MVIIQTRWYLVGRITIFKLCQLGTRADFSQGPPCHTPLLQPLTEQVQEKITFEGVNVTGRQVPRAEWA